MWKNKLLFFFFFLPGLSVYGQIDIVTMEAGLEGYVRYQRWMPVVFELKNRGSSFQGFIQVHVGNAIFEKSLDLDSHATKRIEILAYFPNTFEATGYSILNLQKKVIQRVDFPIRLLNYTDNLILVISDHDYNHQFLNGVQNPWGGKTFVVYRNSRKLYSSWLAYSSADALAFGTFSPASLSGKAWKELILFIAHGGVLLCSPATDFTILQDPLLQSVMPRIMPGFTAVSRGEFLIPAWKASKSEPFPAIEIPLQEIQPRPVHEDLFPGSPAPIALSAPYYKGNIIYFALDYTRIPEQVRSVMAWQLNHSLFPSRGPAPAFGNPFRRKLEHNPQIQSELYKIPGLYLPDVKWFALYFFLYLIIVGPFQYLVLRFLRKQRILWISFPAIILLFTAVSVGYAKYRHSGHGSLTQATVVEVFPSLDLQVIFEVYGIATADSDTFNIQPVPSTGYLTKSVRDAMDYRPEPYCLKEDPPVSIHGEYLKQWSFRTYESIAAVPADKAILVEARIEGKSLKGTVFNSTPSLLKRAFFFYDPQNIASLPNIAPGSRKTFVLELTGSSPLPMGERHLRDLLNLYNLSYSRPHFFFAEIQGSKGAVILNGQKMETALQKFIAVYVLIEQAGPKNRWPTDFTVPPQ